MKPLVVIVGPTASGKSELAVHIAQKFGCEIISADSWQVRRGLNIGTSKASPHTQALVPHHLIDVVAAGGYYSAAEYKKGALKAIEDIYKRGKLPLLVGGTGLYIDSVLFDYSFLPPADRKTRSKLNSMSLEQLTLLANHRNLAMDSIDRRNKRRLIRLIETEGGVATKGPPREDSLVIGLRPDGDELYAAINARVENMVRQGLEAEVKRLATKYGWESEALKGIGYSEWQLYLDGQQSLDTTKQRIIKNSLKLARRQVTWFRRNKSIHWFLTPVDLDKVDELITTFLSKYSPHV